jgi:hypothetical protein
MSAAIRTIALISVIGTMACGATTSGTSGSTTAPVNTSPQQVNTSQYGVVPVGQELDVRLATTLSSNTATVEQRFDTTTVADLMQDSKTLIPAGTLIRGVVTAVNPAGRIQRAGSLTLSFDELELRGRAYPMRAMATNVFQSGGIREEGGKAGVGAGAGAIVGGIIGGLSGALLGAVIGAGGAIVATEGKDIELPAGSIIRIRLDQPLTVR